MSKDNNKLEVWLDANFLGKMHKVGLLAHNRGQVRFHYDKAWLKHPSCFALDPDLTLMPSLFSQNRKSVILVYFWIHRLIAGGKRS